MNHIDLELERQSQYKCSGLGVQARYVRYKTFEKWLMSKLADMWVV